MADYTLALDGSTYAGSVALFDGRDLLAEASLPDSGIPTRGQRGEDFMPMVVECLASKGVKPTELARVVCGSGPGSFTSLRIAASIAKGIAAGVGCPLYAVSSLLLIATYEQVATGHYFVSLPAMRGDSYIMSVTIDRHGVVHSEDSHSIVPTEKLGEVAGESNAKVLGHGFQNHFRPHARGLAKLFEQVLESGPVDVDSWEPEYGRLAEAQVKWEAAHGRPLVAES